MNRAFRSFFLALVCLGIGTWLLCSPREPKPLGTVSAPGAPIAASPAPATTAPAPAPAARSRIGFRTRDRLEDHFQKHGREFSAQTADAYLALAQTLRAAPPAGDVLEITRPTDGVISKFDRASGAFIAFDGDSIIRTFFRPNDGEAYFQRQSRRRPRS